VSAGSGFRESTAMSSDASRRPARRRHGIRPKHRRPFHQRRWRPCLPLPERASSNTCADTVLHLTFELHHLAESPMSAHAIPRRTDGVNRANARLEGSDAVERPETQISGSPAEPPVGSASLRDSLAPAATN